MRVTDKMNTNQSLGNIQKNRADMVTYQNQAATQKRINKPSDDPLGAARVLESRMQIKGIEQYKRNILSAKEFVEFSEQSLGQVTELLIRAKELAIDQADDAGNGEESRRIVATEVRQLYEQLVSVANRTYGDRFLFGGYKSTEMPFDLSGKYYGDDAQVEVEVDRGAYMAMNMPGSVVFLGQKLGQEPMLEVDAAGVPLANQAGSPQGAPVPARGLDSVEGDADLQTQMSVPQGHWGPKSVNIFEVLTELEFGLRANDKPTIQGTLTTLDHALSQINMARGELGARVGALNTGLETLQKLNVDNKAVQSEIEDVDMFELVSNLNKTQTQLEATLSTSGKLMQKSLLDFLR
jgi:flagellar hook-associated protein 3 FlgL